MISFQIISTMGTARSLYIEAIESAKKGNFEEAKRKITEGQSIFVEGHKIHAQLIQQEANHESIQINMLLIHAEDQLMSAEAFGILSIEFVDLYEKIINISK